MWYFAKIPRQYFRFWKRTNERTRERINEYKKTIWRTHFIHRHFALKNKRDYTFCQTWKMNLAYKRRERNGSREWNVKKERQSERKKIWIVKIGLWLNHTSGSNRFTLSVFFPSPLRKDIGNLCRDFMIFMTMRDILRWFGNIYIDRWIDRYTHFYCVMRKGRENGANKKYCVCIRVCVCSSQDVCLFMNWQVSLVKVRVDNLYSFFFFLIPSIEEINRCELIWL